jgi:hypothetical protein
VSTGPNPISVAISMLRARRVSKPKFSEPCIPVGSDAVDHSELRSVLLAASAGGVSAIGGLQAGVERYSDTLATIDPDDLRRSEALAYWLNLYNAGALLAAGQAHLSEAESVLRVPGAFTSAWIEVAGVPLSLDEIEHGKIRRFHDPRIHGALICGSVSCPTLRPTPFTGTGLGDQLDDQMRSFITRGGGSLNRGTKTLTLSRVFKWYGRDFVSPSKMPTILPASGRRVATAVAPWFPETDAEFIVK